MKASRRLVAVLGIAALVGCGSETNAEPEYDDRGDLTLLVAGDDIAHTLTGNAVFGTASTRDGMTEWVLFLWRGEVLAYSYQFDVVDFYRANLERPSQGTYALSAYSAGIPEDSDFAGTYIFSFVISYGVFHVELGTLTIETSSNQEITGSFELTAVLDENQANEVQANTATLTGTFRAVPGDIPIVY